jgi:hypothetical protein
MPNANSFGVAFADDHRAGLAEARHRDRVGGGKPRPAARPRRRRQAGDVDDVLDADRNAGQRAGAAIVERRFGAPRRGQRALRSTYR